MISEERADSLANGRLLGHYRISRKLGAGGMGEVYLGEDARLRRKVALKILPPDIAEDGKRLRRFEQEAFAASALNHPNILTVYEFGEESGLYFLATELVEGETLREKIRGGELSIGKALNVAEQIAFALTASHDAGIVHRDLKPENIMIRRDGIVKVLDFGIAKLTAPNTDSSDSQVETLAKFNTQTKEGTIIGTLNYMSPEQVRGQAIDARSDIFSLGVVIYEMLTGKAPFGRPTAGDAIAAILTEHPPPLTETGIEAPAELQRIISKALRKNRDERYQNSKDLLLDIKSLEREIEFSTNPRAASGGASAGQTENLNNHTTNPAVQAKFTPYNILAFLLVAIAAFGGIWWFASRNNFQSQPPQRFSPNIAEIVNWKSSPGEVYNGGSISPDGKMIAFASTESGALNIWIKQLSGGNAVQISKDQLINQHLVWSPDGDEIAFFSTRGSSPGIWRVSALGGSPVFVKSIEDASMILRRWSKKGVVYYESKTNLYALDVKSGHAAQLTNLDSKKVNPKTISISPDEEQIAYVVSENDQFEIWTTPANGGMAKQILSQTEQIRNLVWHPDSKRILYSTATGEVFQIFAIDASGGNPMQITFGDKDAFALDVSADGGKILYASSKEESDLWGAKLEKSEEFPVAADINSELWAAVAPDGKTIAYQSIINLSQGNKIFIGAILSKSAVTDSQATQLISAGFLPGFSPDGKQLAFMRLSDDKYNLWIVKSPGGEEKQLTVSGMPSLEYTVLPYNRTQTSYFCWSPDSQRIAYAANSDGRRNIWAVNADGSGNIQLTKNEDPNLSICCPLWSPDGRQIAYFARSEKRAPDGKKFYAAFVLDLKTGNLKQAAQTENFQRIIGWSETGKDLFLAAIGIKDGTGKPIDVNIIQINTETGDQRELAKLETAYLYNISLSADKKMLGYVSKKDGRDNLWVMRLGGEARKITSNNDPKLYFSSLAWSPDAKAVYFGKQTRYSLLSMITNFK